MKLELTKLKSDQPNVKRYQYAHATICWLIWEYIGEKKFAVVNLLDHAQKDVFWFDGIDVAKNWCEACSPSYD